jgi:phosphoribosylformylglycinamidine synthase PurS subunit
MITGHVKILIQPNVLDVQGQAVKDSLKHMGFDTIESIRVGKLIEVVMQDGDEETVKSKLNDMSEKLFANVVIEDFEIEIRK